MLYPGAAHITKPHASMVGAHRSNKDTGQTACLRRPWKSEGSTGRCWLTVRTEVPGLGVGVQGEVVRIDGCVMGGRMEVRSERYQK